MNVKDAAIRAVRTFFQTAIGAFLATGVLANGTVDLEGLQVAAVAAGIAGVSAVLTFLQNLLEDNTNVNIPK